MINSDHILVDQIYFDPKLPPGALDMQRILFLDFDGVLHPFDAPSYMDFCYVCNFCELLREADPDGELPIVISSDWRFSTSLEKLRSHFPDDLGRQLVGVTSHLPSPSIGWDRGSNRQAAPGQRQREIESWMADYAPGSQWMAIDDRPTLFKENCSNLFCVPSLHDEEGVGLNSTVCIDLRDRLSNFLDKTSPIAKIKF